MTVTDKSPLFEIVELDNGDVALRKAHEQESTPLVTIKFSEESAYYLDDARFEIAKIMIEAGLDAVAEYQGSDSLEDDESIHRSESNLIH